MYQWLLLFTIASSCQDPSDWAIKKKEFDEAGRPRRFIYQKENSDKTLIREFDEQGNLYLEYYKKNEQYDSIVKVYAKGILQKTMEIDSLSQFNGKTYFYKPDGRIDGITSMLDAQRHGWMVTFGETQDTILINYYIKGTCHYIKQKKNISGETVWREQYDPAFMLDNDSVKVGAKIKGIIDLPLPDSVFDMKNLEIYLYETSDPNIIAHPLSFINYSIPLSDMKKVDFPASIEVVAKQPTQNVYLLQVIKRAPDSIIRYQFIKRKVAFYQ